MFDHIKKCALHRQLNMPCSEPIKESTLHGIIRTPVGHKYDGLTVTTRLKRRAVFAHNFRRR